MTLQLPDILAQEAFYRRAFMNTLPGPRGVHLIGTKGHRGNENLGVFSSVVHLQATPPMLGFIVRPLTVARETYHNILATKHYTINTIIPERLEAAHRSSANYPVGISEFAEIEGLDPWYSDHVKAPYVAFSPVKIGLEYLETHQIQGGTLFVVGKVIEVILADDAAVAVTGHVDHQHLDTLAVAGLDTYYRLQDGVRLEYPRP